MTSITVKCDCGFSTTIVPRAMENKVVLFMDDLTQWIQGYRSGSFALEALTKMVSECEVRK